MPMALSGILGDNVAQKFFEFVCIDKECIVNIHNVNYINSVFELFLKLTNSR